MRDLEAYLKFQGQVEGEWEAWVEWAQVRGIDPDDPRGRADYQE